MRQFGASARENEQPANCSKEGLRKCKSAIGTGHLYAHWAQCAQETVDKLYGQAGVGYENGPRGPTLPVRIASKSNMGYVQMDNRCSNHLNHPQRYPRKSTDLRHPLDPCSRRIAVFLGLSIFASNKVTNTGNKGCLKLGRSLLVLIVCDSRRCFLSETKGQ